MTSIERIEREIADMRYQMGTVQKEKTQSKRFGFTGLIGTFILGFILGMVVGYFLLT